MALAIFDLDETLIATDSDHAWGDFVADRGLVDPDSHRRRNREFYESYKRGKLDIDAYLRFACTALARFDMETLEKLRCEFLEERIKPALLTKAEALVDKHRRDGDCLVVVTATIEFITAPIVAHFGIEHLIAPTPEIVDGRYTGEVTGVPSFGPGKVTRLEAWLAEQGETLSGSYFYTDSKNDLPLLERVDHPVAVDPDTELRRFAETRQWPIITLRD